jgi:hypothetical protein
LNLSFRYDKTEKPIGTKILAKLGELMKTSSPGYAFVEKKETLDSSPLKNPLSSVVVVDNSSKIYKSKQQQQSEQQQELQFCELEFESWDCDFGTNSDGDYRLDYSDLNSHIASPEHIRGMIRMLQAFGITGKSVHSLPTNYPHQTDSTLIHIRDGMTDGEKRAIRNWGGFVRWYITSQAGSERPKFNPNSVPFAAPPQSRYDDSDPYLGTGNKNYLVEGQFGSEI